ncbi:MAG TPA: ShlB/FhaC/HecB family hemolysin secretion/activation protein [Dissulfurispiraceae bacterium]
MFAIFFLMLWGFCAAAAAAEEAGDAIPRFDIQRYAVEGNTLLSQKVIDVVLGAFVGKQRDFGTVQEALEALEKAYRDRGYTMVQVVLPEQELEKGVVRLKVVELRIGQVKGGGNKYFEWLNIRNSLPGLREGQSPNLGRISASLKLANENPAKKVNLQLQNGSKEDEVDAVLQVADERPWKVGLTMDNTGNSQTGSSRVGVLFQHANVFNRDHLLTLQYITSPEKPDKVNIYSAGYRIPFYGIGSSLDLIGGYSNVNSGTISVANYALNVSGKGTILGAHFNQSLKRIDNYEHKLVYSLDYRAFENTVDLQGIPLGNDITVHPVSLTYAGTLTDEKGETAFYLTALQNIPWGITGKDSRSYFEKARGGAPPGYHVLKLGVNVMYLLGRDWQGRLALSGQFTEQALVPGEQFGMGGEGSVRGFGEREISNDNGYYSNLELYTPDLCKRWKMKTSTQCRVLGFYDRGYAWRNHHFPGEATNTTISSTGAGLRVSSGTTFFTSVDYGVVVDGGGVRERWSGRLHIKAGVLF